MLLRGTRIIVGGKHAEDCCYRSIVGQEHIIEKGFYEPETDFHWYDLSTTLLSIRKEDAIPIKIMDNASATHFLKKEEDDYV